MNFLVGVCLGASIMYAVLSLFVVWPLRRGRAITEFLAERDRDYDRDQALKRRARIEEVLARTKETLARKRRNDS